MKRMFRKWELVVGECVKRGTDEIILLAFMDIFIMIFAVGVCTILGSLVEFTIGTPNWAEMVLAWLIIYGFMFNYTVIDGMAVYLARDDLEPASFDDLYDYVKERFDEEL